VGFRPDTARRSVTPRVTVTELGGGLLLVLGLLTPPAAAGEVGTMLLALVAQHLRNGFFIFGPGEGYEYVLMISLVSCALGALDSGECPLDRLLGIHLSSTVGLVVAAGGGGFGATLLLLAYWRPEKQRLGW
jgi:putative oxidoreductase